MFRGYFFLQVTTSWRACLCIHRYHGNMFTCHDAIVQFASARDDGCRVIRFFQSGSSWVVFLAVNHQDLKWMPNATNWYDRLSLFISGLKFSKGSGMCNTSCICALDVAGWCTSLAAIWSGVSWLVSILIPLEG